MIPSKPTLQTIRQGLRSRAFSSVELTRHYLEAIRRDSLNAFITVNDHAIEAARHADKRIADGDAGPLTGIPVAIKDVLVTKGLRTTAASKMLEDYVPAYTATAVQRLVDAGMIIIGKTNCDEFAMGASNENSAFGPVRNPHDPTRVAGGSSGGSAASVAADLAPVALGTDTGGSVRLPAAFCGVIGLKPTYGRISRHGLIAMASSFDTVGIISHSADDAGLLLETMAGHDVRDATSSRVPVVPYGGAIVPKKLRVGIPREFVQDTPESIRELIDAAKHTYATVFPDVEFVDVSIPRLPYSLAVYYVCVPAEVSANMARYDGLRYGKREAAEESLEEVYRHNRASFGPEVRRRILLGTYALSAGYYDAYYRKAMRVRKLLQADFIHAFQKADVLLAPASPSAPFRIGEKISDPLAMYLMDAYMVAANLVGIPAVTYPVGSENGLPIAAQLLGPTWSENLLLALVQRAQPARA